MPFSRRTFGKLAVAAVPVSSAFAAAQPINSTFHGVRLGIGSYSFRGLTLTDIVSQMAAIPMGELELESWFVEPAAVNREALRQWRLTVPLDELRAIRKQFEDAGIHIYAYNIPVDESFTTEELDRVFQMARALGVDILNVVSMLPAAPQLIAPSAQYKMRVGFHTAGAAQNPNSMGSGDSYRQVIALAPNFGINPDLGQCARWGPDPLAFLREMHLRVTTLHTHDRGPTAYTAFGQGQMPIREILQLIKAEKYSFIPMIERIQRPVGSDSVTELRRSVDYCKSVLAP